MKEKEYKRINHPLKPLYDKYSKILILGSFPSVKSREENFFYGHAQNRFWKLISVLLKEDEPKDIESKKKILLYNNIAVYDVIKSCDIVGSSDSSIKNVVPTDLRKVVQNSNIKKVFCNGGLSYKYYNLYHKDILKIKATKLPSTSPANARYRLDDLIENWKIILEYLES